MSMQYRLFLLSRTRFASFIHTSLSSSLYWSESLTPSLFKLYWLQLYSPVPHICNGRNLLQCEPQDILLVALCTRIPSTLYS
jgi:hypothetical protein